MQGTALLWLPDVLRAAGVKVVEFEGWRLRARSSGGFGPGKPYAVFWHHTASKTTPQNDAAYCCYGAEARPLTNLLMTRTGECWVLSAGATNTNGKGKRIPFSRGVVEIDSANSAVVGMEICNTGIGEAYPQVQIDACFAASNAINAYMGNQPTDVSTHQFYAPDRKIDPAQAAAVQGPWKPSAINGVGSWNLADLRAECARRAVPAPGPGPTPPPTPTPGGDDVQVRLLTLSDSDAQFLAQCDDQGQALYITWAGPGGAGSAADRAVAAHRAEANRKGHPFDQKGDLAGLFNCVRVGPLPYGDSKHNWDGSETWSSAT